MLLELTEYMINRCFACIPRKKPAAERLQQARLIAHRGAHNNRANIIENTLEAFKLAEEAGCWGIEFDVHATADEVLVVNHDPDLNRLWGKNAVIAELSFAQLRALEPRIPSLDDVLTQCKKMHFFIELKAPFRHSQRLAETLHALTPEKDYHLLALSEAIFHHLPDFPKQALILVAVHNNVKTFCKASLEKQYGGVTGSYLLLTDNYLNQLQQAGQRYGVGFVDSKNSLFRELNRGISWIFTNRALDVAPYLRNKNADLF